MTTLQDRKDDVVTAPIGAETTVLIENYKIIADWIRFADAKAGVVLGVQGVLASILVPIASQYYDAFKQAPAGRTWPYVVLAVYGVWFVLFLASTIAALRCIVPQTRKGVHASLGRCDHFHPAAISARYGVDEIERFQGDHAAMGSEGIKREILQGMLIDSHISAAKYGAITLSLRLFSVELFAAFLFYILSRH